ncbi:MAG: AsmA-like C-terminal domain-containing protein [Geminicoccaceae bacterium]
MLIWLLVGLVLALVLILARLSAGPIQLDWLAPRIEQALSLEGETVAATLGRAELRFDQTERALKLVGVDVRYRSLDEGHPSPSPFLVFPEVEVKPSVEAFLKTGVITASEIIAKAPSLIVTRDKDGVISLFSEIAQGNRQDVDFGAFLSRFALSGEENLPLASLKKLQISGGRIAYYDQARASALTAEDADLVMTRQDQGVDAWLRGHVMQPTAGLASFQLTGRIDPKGDRITFEADVADLMPAELPALWPLHGVPVPTELAGLRLPVRASIAGDIGLDGSFSPMTIDIKGSAGVVDLPAHLAVPLEVDGFELEGEVADDLGALEITDARIESRGAEIGGSGTIVWRRDERALALDLSARRVSARNLPAFWPPRLGAKARTWVLANVGEGLISEGMARLDIQPDDWGPAPIRADAVTGTFAFETLSVRYLKEMPPLRQAHGTATFDAKNLDFDVGGGNSAGLNLTAGRVTLSGLGKPKLPPTQLAVHAEAEGSMEQALALLDHPPFEVAKKLKITPAAIDGRTSISLDVDMPIFQGVKAKDATVRAEAEMNGVALDRLPKLGDNVRLDEGAFRLLLEDDTVSLDGTAEVNGLPIAISLSDPLTDETSKRRIYLAGDISLEQLERQGLAVDGLDGAFGFKATVTETGSRFWVDLDADLEKLAISPPRLEWEKTVGQPGKLRASIAVPIEGAIEVKQFDIDTGGLEASGSFALSSSNKQVTSLKLDGFRLGDTDGAARISPDGEGGYNLAIDADRLDLDALFGADGKINQAFENFHVDMRAGWLRTRGIELTDVLATAAHTSEGWRLASVDGVLASGGKLALELLPDESGDLRLEVRSERAGALITALDLGQKIDDGNMLLTATIKSQDPASAQGRFEIRSFVLKDAPLLARMLTLASLTGIGNLLGGEGIQVDHLILPFDLDDRTLTFTDGLMRGSQLGLTVKGDVELKDKTVDLEGTIIPVYSLNRLIGQLPVVGSILKGESGRGAFAATFALTGPHEQPQIYVNPLSIVTPGFIRDLVSGLINGTLEPPEARETDD